MGKKVKRVGLGLRIGSTNSLSSNTSVDIFGSGGLKESGESSARGVTINLKKQPFG
jgi:hypothetical protein